MEIEAAPGVADTPASAQGVVSAHAEGFGIRPRTDRPHSINLFRTEPGSQHNGGPRSFDILFGVGIGALAMYYLDPDLGARRRTAARDGLVEVVSLVLARGLVRERRGTNGEG